MGKRSLNRFKHKPDLAAGFGPLFITEGDGGGGGGKPDDGGKPAEDAGKPKEEAKPKDEKLLTQSEVNAIAAREKAEGKRAAETALAETLGVSIEDAKQIIAKHRETEEASKTEAQKAREAAEAEKAAAGSEKTAAQLEVHQTRLERAFLKEGLDLEEADDKAKRVLRMVTVEAGASYEDVLKDVKQIKTDFPALFGADESAPKRRSPSGDPKGNPPKQTGGEDAFARGAERAKGHRGAYMATVDNVKK